MVTPLGPRSAQSPLSPSAPQPPAPPAAPLLPDPKSAATPRADAFESIRRTGKEARIWARYRPGTSLPDGRALGRILWVMSQVQPLLGGADPLALADNKIRQPLFLLEGTLRAYSKDFPGLETPLDAVKNLEDLIGAYGAPQSDAEKAIAAKNLTACVEQSWTPGADGKAPGLDSVLSAVEAQPLGDDTADHDRMRAALVDIVKRIGTKPYDMSTLQGNSGLHELRRQLRWVELYNKVAKMDGPSLNLLPAPLIGGFSKGNSDLSPIKDRGEEAEALAKKKLAASGGTLSEQEARDQATAELGPDYGKDALTAAANEVYQRILAEYAKYLPQL